MPFKPTKHNPEYVIFRFCEIWWYTSCSNSFAIFVRQCFQMFSLMKFSGFSYSFPFSRHENYVKIVHVLKWNQQLVETQKVSRLLPRLKKYIYIIGEWMLARAQYWAVPLVLSLTFGTICGVSMKKSAMFFALKILFEYCWLFQAWFFSFGVQKMLHGWNLNILWKHNLKFKNVVN